jgi:DNA-binding transcriptional ArsR family regulator
VELYPKGIISAPSEINLENAKPIRYYVMILSHRGVLMTLAQNAERYEMQAEVLRALAHPIRLAVLDILKDGERCVCEIVEALASLGAERSNVSRHLAVMRQGGLVRDRKAGLKVFYELRTPCVTGFLSCVDGVLHDRLARHEKALT